MLGMPDGYRLAAEKNKDNAEIVSELEAKAKKVEQMLEMWADRPRYLEFLKLVDTVLDEVEEELNREDRLGPWLCGPAFSAADITLTSFLMRLYQVREKGKENFLWHCLLFNSFSLFSSAWMRSIGRAAFAHAWPSTRSLRSDGQAWSEQQSGGRGRGWR